MTIKEIRIKKGLSQKEAAEILSISRRTLQNLEDKDIGDNIKLKTYFQILCDYQPKSFHCDVSLSEDLKLMISSVKKFKKRYCFKQIQNYLENDYKGKVLILYGLRRTGKTVLIFQSIQTLNIEKTAYIKAREANSIGDVIADLDKLYKMGIKYVFIDEITLVNDFINSAATFSDIYSMYGMKIVLSGTDSLGFAFADKNELYDRNIRIHTSYISFKEFAYVLDIHSLDTYIEYGGTFKIENMNFDDPDNSIDEVSFRNDESTRKYIDTAISRNIQRTLKNNNFGNEFYHLKELYDQNELTNVIYRVVENMNHEFVLSVIEERFKSHDLGSARQILTKDEDATRRLALFKIDNASIIDRLKKIIDVKEKEELNVVITSGHIEQIKKYLFELDLIDYVEEKMDDGSSKSKIVFTQPGMRYSIAKALVFSLLKDEYFSSLSENDKNVIIETILNDVKGRMEEDIVLYETKKISKEKCDIFKFKFILGGEYDMIKYFRNTNSFSVFEIKHSSQISFANQTKYLKDKSFLANISHRFGNLISKNVLYRGEDTSIEDINYLNVEKYLESL